MLAFVLVLAGAGLSPVIVPLDMNGLFEAAAFVPPFPAPRSAEAPKVKGAGWFGLNPPKIPVEGAGAPLVSCEALAAAAGGAGLLPNEKRPEDAGDAPAGWGFSVLAPPPRVVWPKRLGVAAALDGLSVFSAGLEPKLKAGLAGWVPWLSAFFPFWATVWVAAEPNPNPVVAVDGADESVPVPDPNKDLGAAPLAALPSPAWLALGREKAVGWVVDASAGFEGAPKRPCGLGGFSAGSAPSAACTFWAAEGLGAAKPNGAAPDKEDPGCDALPEPVVPAGLAPPKEKVGGSCLFFFLSSCTCS